MKVLGVAFVPVDVGLYFVSVIWPDISNTIRYMESKEKEEKTTKNKIFSEVGQKQKTEKKERRETEQW